MSFALHLGSPFWLSSEPLILASRSSARFSLLRAAAIPVEVCPSSLDERQVEEPAVVAGATPSEIALLLARAKASHVSASQQARYVLGADQVLAFGGAILHKPRNRDELRERLTLLSQKTHFLHAAAAIARDGGVVFEVVDVAAVTFRTLSQPFIARYVAAAGPAALASVGGYEVEGLGQHLVDRVEGRHATVLGLPLPPLLEGFRQLGLLSA